MRSVLDRVVWGACMLLFLWAAASTASRVAVGPVVIVPGTGGSQLEGKLSKPSTPHFYCEKTSDWYRLWLSVTQLLPSSIDCWIDNIRLLYDPATGQYTNNIGVKTRIVDWGGTLGFEYLDPSFKVGESDYMHTLVEALVNNGGLVRNITLRGAPYDFRYGPQHGWVAKMTSLIEETFHNAENTKVTLLSHSLGCVFSLYFLNQKEQAWKDRYIRKWIPTSGVFGGTGEGLMQLLSGDSAGTPVSARKLRGEQRSWESSMILAPTPLAFGSQVLVTTPGGNFTALEYDKLLAMAGMSHGYQRWVAAYSLAGEMVPPNVSVTHLFGVGVPTPTSYNYRSTFDDDPEVTMGDGDGTVGIDSLNLAAKCWNTSDSHLFTAQTFLGLTHTGILKADSYVKAVVDLLRI